MTTPEEHHSVRILLLNDRNEVLLMRAEDPSTTETDGTHHGAFWFLIGGEIEPGEALEEAAYRELFEETGLRRDHVNLGPEVWYGDFHLILSGKKRHMKQRFIFARTGERRVSFTHLTEAERKVVSDLQWFSLERMRRCGEVIYPVGLDEFLEPLLRGNLPEKPMQIALDRRPG